MDLYHSEVYMPTNLPTKLTNVRITASRHATEQATTKGIELPDVVTGTLFELAVDRGKLIKVGIRCRYSDTHDLCVIISSAGVLITAWLNSVNDTHKTLDTTKYNKQ